MSNHRETKDPRAPPVLQDSMVSTESPETQELRAPRETTGSKDSQDQADPRDPRENREAPEGRDLMELVVTPERLDPRELGDKLETWEALEMMG